jgi:hypothetical protein
MIKRVALVTSAIVSLAALSAPASAVTILVFGQSSGQGNVVTATANGSNTATTIAGNNIMIDITSLFGTSSSPTAYLTFTATSTAAAQTLESSFVYQPYGGTFSITSLAGGLGVNYLSGAFAGLELGSGSSAVVSGSEPGNVVSYTSDVITGLSSPRALSLSFANVTSPIDICGSTLCSFTSSISGNFSSAVPEPASWAMMVGGFGLLGAAMRRRRPNTAVSFS